MYWIFENLFSLDGYFAQPRYNREGLGPSPKAMCLTLSEDLIGVKWEECVEEMGGGARMGTWIGIF